MSKVRRYDNDPDNYYGMRDRADGEFVEYDDYALLLERFIILERERDELLRTEHL